MTKFDTDRIPTAWFDRPVSSAARVGEQSGVTWKFVNCRPLAARASMFGVSMSEPKHPNWAKPVSSMRMRITFGESSPGWAGTANHGSDSATVRPILPWNSFLTTIRTPPVPAAESRDVAIVADTGRGRTPVSAE